MNIVIFSGFLGAGKTSLILSLAQFITKKEDKIRDGHLVIIENEIGGIGVDEKILRAKGYQVKELFAGCICCTLSIDLTIMLNELEEEYQPEWVIMECTGLAYPGKIVETLSRYGKNIEKIQTITVIDAERCEEVLEVAPILVSRQIEEGDILLINKSDLVDECDLTDLEGHVREINGNAKLFRTVASNDIDHGLWNEVTGIDE